MSDKTKSLAEQRMQLEQKLAEIKRQEADIIEKKKVIIGNIVWDEMQRNDEFNVHVMGLLDSQTSKNTDRTLFGLAKRDRKPKSVNGGDVVGEG